VTPVLALLRGRGIGSLATLEPATGHPYASLITVATETDGSPIFLISKLAWHTRNLEADPRASILLAAESGPGDPLNLGRVSLMGVAERTENSGARRRFLAKHPGAAFYADFADFSFWRLRIEQLHYVGGFGRITTPSAKDILFAPAAAKSWDERIEAAIDTANASEWELIDRLAGSLTGKMEPGWRIAACDPEGCDLVSEQDVGRLVFPARLEEPDALVDLLRELGRHDPTLPLN